MKVIIAIVPLEWLWVSNIPFVPKESGSILSDISIGVVKLTFTCLHKKIEKMTEREVNHVYDHRTRVLHTNNWRKKGITNWFHRSHTGFDYYSRRTTNQSPTDNSSHLQVSNCATRCAAQPAEAAKYLAK